MELEFDDFDYYDILNLPPNASQDEIKTNYRNLIRLWHPDKHSSSLELTSSATSNHSNDPNSNNLANDNDDSTSNKRDSAFSKIQKAYSVLSDPILRAQYDKYGHEGATLAKLIMNEKVTERTVYSIPEDLPEYSPKEEISNIEKTNEYVSKRVYLLLRDRYARELKMLPFQVITNYTFNARTDLFSDESLFKRKKRDKYARDIMLPRRYLYLTGTSVDNSIELLYNKYRFGSTISTVLSRGTFGNMMTRLYISKDFSDKLELRVSADTGDFLKNRMLLVSLKNKFTETFWSTFILTLSGRLMPNLYAVFHKSINKRHSFEITLTNGIFLDYSYLKVLNKYSKVNFKVVATPDNMGVEFRSKTLNVYGSTLGAVVRLCLVKGFTFEWFLRTFVESNYLGIMKVEYRLCLSNNKVLLILKGTINNSKVNVPILLYRGDQNHAVYLVSSLTAFTFLLPLISNGLTDAYYRILKLTKKHIGEDSLLNRLGPLIADDDGKHTYSLRNNFYVTFPQFFKRSYSSHFKKTISDIGLYEHRHIKYYHYPPISTGSHDGDFNDNTQHNDPKFNGYDYSNDFSRDDDPDRKIATDENNKLYNIARSAYFRELEKKGVLVLLALYGHPKVLEYLDHHYKSIEFNTDRYSTHSEDVNGLLSKEEAKEFFESGFNPNKYVFNVTNILMSKVNNSTLFMSGRNKDNLIGFYNPCKNLKVTPKLFIIYKYGTEIRSITIEHNHPVLLP